MKLLLILVGFFACMSVERVGFRKWSFVFRPGILFLVVMVALVCAGCSPTDGARGNADVVQIDVPQFVTERIDIRTDSATGCQYLAYRQNLTPRMAADGKQICRKPSL